MKISDSNLGQLISGLIYPAVLGASIVYFFQKISIQFRSPDFPCISLTDITNWAALWLLSYFCLVYISMTNYRLKKKYDIIHAILDFLEVLVIFTGLFVLGFVTDNFVEIRYFYWVILAIPLLALLTNCHVKGKIHWWQIISTIVISIVMICINPPIESTWHGLALIVLYFMLFSYSAIFTNHRTKIE